MHLHLSHTVKKTLAISSITLVSLYGLGCAVAGIKAYQDTHCSSPELSTQSLSYLINEYRVNNGKTQLKQVPELSQFTDSKLATVSSFSNSTTINDYNTWILTHIAESNRYYLSDSSVFYNDQSQSNMCQVFNTFTGNVLTKDVLLNKPFDVIGVSVEGSNAVVILGSSQYLQGYGTPAPSPTSVVTPVATANAEEKSKQARRSNAQSEIDRLTAARDDLLKTVNEQTAQRDACASDLCREYNTKAINAQLDAVSSINKQILDWKLKLNDSL